MTFEDQWKLCSKKYTYLNESFKEILDLNKKIRILRARNILEKHMNKLIRKIHSEIL